MVLLIGKHVLIYGSSVVFQRKTFVLAYNEWESCGDREPARCMATEHEMDSIQWHRLWFHVPNMPRLLAHRHMFHEHALAF